MMLGVRHEISICQRLTPSGGIDICTSVVDRQLRSSVADLKETPFWRVFTTHCRPSEMRVPHTTSMPRFVESMTLSQLSKRKSFKAPGNSAQLISSALRLKGLSPRYSWPPPPRSPTRSSFGVAHAHRHHLWLWRPPGTSPVVHARLSSSWPRRDSNASFYEPTAVVQRRSHHLIEAADTVFIAQRLFC